MGYSARYHATSLIAVFLSLAIGILIGAEFGGDALTTTRKNLEASLVGNLQDARQGRRTERRTESLQPVRRARLPGSDPRPPEGQTDRDRRLRRAAERNFRRRSRKELGPTGAQLVGVGVVREPVDVSGFAADLSKTRFFDLQTNPDQLTALGKGLGRQLVIGGTLPDVVRGQLFSRASGSFGALDGVIVVRNQPTDMGPVQRSTAAPVRIGAAERDDGDQDAGRRDRDDRRPNRPRSPSSRATPSPASMTST